MENNKLIIGLLGDYEYIIEYIGRQRYKKLEVVSKIVDVFIKEIASKETSIIIMPIPQENINNINVLKKNFGKRFLLIYLEDCHSDYVEPKKRSYDQDLNELRKISDRIIDFVDYSDLEIEINKIINENIWFIVDFFIILCLYVKSYTS